MKIRKCSFYENCFIGDEVWALESHFGETLQPLDVMRL